MLKVERPANKIDRVHEPKLGSDLSDAPSRALPVEVGAQPLAALIARVEAATGDRDPQLVADIYNALGDQVLDRGKLGWTWRPEGRGFWHNLPDLLNSLDAALALMGRVLPGWNFVVGTMPGGVGFYAALGAGDGPAETGPTPALALLSALLRALQAQAIRHDARDGASHPNNGAA